MMQTMSAMITDAPKLPQYILTIGAAHAMRGGVEQGFDFAKRLTEPAFTHFSGSKLRLGASCSIAPKNAADMMATLRAHDSRDALEARWLAEERAPMGEVRTAEQAMSARSGRGRWIPHPRRIGIRRTRRWKRRSA
jgi:hypothetical protein